MSDILKEPGPGFDEPLEMLHACHERITAQIDTLGRLREHLAQHGADESARQAAAGILRYFDSAGPHHHHDEEEDLFPRLIERAAGQQAERVVAMVEQLKAEHRKMEARWSSLRVQLAEIASGEAAQLNDALAEDFQALYMLHIASEEAGVLPLAASLLDSADAAEIGARMAQRRGVRVAGKALKG